MKRTITLFAISIFLIGLAQAQTTRYGVKAGASFATLVGENTNVGMKIGINGGAYASFGLSEKFAVQPELLISMKGAKESLGGFDVNYNLMYIDVPILAQIWVSEGFNLYLGPQVGILVSDKISSDGQSGSFEELLGVDMNSLEIALATGVNYELENGLNFTGRMNYGFTSIFDIEGTDISVKNLVFQVGVGYTFVKN